MSLVNNLYTLPRLLSTLPVIAKLDCLRYIGMNVLKSTEVSEYVQTEAKYSSKTSVDIQRTICCYIQEERILRVRKLFSVKDPGELTVVAEGTSKKNVELVNVRRRGAQVTTKTRYRLT